MNKLNSTGVKVSTISLIEKNLPKRYRAEKRFRFYGIISILFGLSCLVVLFSDIIGKGYSAFFQHSVTLTVEFNSDTLGIADATDEEQLQLGNFDGIIRASLRERFPEVSGRSARRQLYALVSNGAGYQLRSDLENDPNLLG